MPDKDTLPFEFRKQLIQFLVVIALGAILAFLVESVRRQSDQRTQDRISEATRLSAQRQYRIDTASSFLGRLDLIYRQVKNSRQRLGFLEIHFESKSVHKEMWRLRAEMEDLEQLAKDIEVYVETIDGLADVRDEVKIMDKYVGDRWKEYRRSHVAAGDEELAARFGDKLSSFVADPERGDFAKFDSSYHNARSTLVRVLIKESGALPAL